MPNHEASFFGTFNARHLTPDEVARSFVPPPCFEQLAGNSHVLLVGPRGSGKTTLLKMLQPQALRSWTHVLAAQYRDAIQYTGAFIPADISWGAQLDSLGYGRLAANNHKILAQASFTTHVLRALIEAILFRVRSWEIGRGQGASSRDVESVETSFVRKIAQTWMLEPSIESLLAIKHSLRERLGSIRTLANQGAYLDQDVFSKDLSSLPSLHIHFMEAVGIGIEIIDDLLGEPGHRWALLFDELEIAPDWVQDEVLRSTRSSDPKLLIKLALSPCTESAKKLLESTLAPAPGHDLLQIPLWYAEKERGYEFCRELWAASLRSKSLPFQSPEDALGPSYFDPEDVSNHYASGGRWTERFASLAARDKSFSEYLARNGIDPERLDLADVPTRDKTIRKAAPVVAVREFFRKSDESGQKRRSRKSGALYAGAESVFAITEGNPRWFKGIVSGLIRHLIANGAPVSEQIQGQEIARTAERLLAMLLTVPSDSARKVERSIKWDACSLLNRIGKYFSDRVVNDEFNPEPPLSFRVDSSAGNHVLELLRTALNRGAIVLVPDTEAESIITSPMGHRFRFSYLLAAHYGLPLRLGKETPLSRVLQPPLGGTEDRSRDLFEGGDHA